MITKICTRCLKDLSLDNYQHQEFGKYQKKSKCRECCRIMLNDWRKRNPAHFRRIGWTYELKRQYNFTPKEYEELLEKQNYGCAICGKSSFRLGKEIKLAVDHDHETKEVRGLLCDTCNRGIGHLRSTGNMIKALRYLMQKGGQNGSIQRTTKKV